MPILLNNINIMYAKVEYIESLEKKNVLYFVNHSWVTYEEGLEKIHLYNLRREFSISYFFFV